MKYLLASFLMASPLFASALELVKYPTVFVAQSGAEVVVVPTTDEEQALVRVSGINHAIDGVVFLADLEARGGKQQAHLITLDGKQRNLVFKRESWGSLYYVLRVPGEEDSGMMKHEEKSKKLKSADVLAIYEQQKKEGTQEKLAKFDRAKYEKGVTAKIAKLDSAANDACGTKLSTQVDWSSISDEQANSLSIPGFCGNMASELKTLCKKSPAIKKDAKAIKVLECRFSDELKLRKKGKKVLLTTNEEEPNQREFVRSFFRNL